MFRLYAQNALCKFVLVIATVSVNDNDAQIAWETSPHSLTTPEIKSDRALQYYEGKRQPRQLSRCGHELGSLDPEKAK